MSNLGRATENLDMVRRHGLFSAYRSGGSFADDMALVLKANREMREALEPFAGLAEWIALNRPDHNTDLHEVQIEGWPYTLSVMWLRRARKILEAK